MTPLKQQISLIPFSLEKGDNTIAAIDIGQIRYRRKGVKKMARTSSITMPSMVGIVRGTPALDEKV